MRPFLEKIETGADSSIKVKSYVQTMIDVPMHFHPEHELVYIQKGGGKILIGDAEEGFQEGELFFISGSVPHLFSDNAMVTGKQIVSKVVVIQFKEKLMEQFGELPEFWRIVEFVKNGGSGYRIRPTASLVKQIRQLEKAGGIMKFNLLFAVLDEILNDQAYELLGSIGNKPMTNHVTTLRLQKLNTYLAGCSREDISIDNAARLLNMNRTAFCRFLKRETGKTFSEHLCFHRINLACRLLRESDQTVMEICYASGFNNPSYFFRRFSQLKGMSPNGYRQG